MTKTYPRKTLAGAVRLDGSGLHTGEPVSVTIHPGEGGLVFRAGSEVIPATVASVTDTSRCTRLGPVGTVEHVLSALAGLGITDAVIEVEGGELPAAGGCALPYVEAVLGAGLADCGTIEVEGPFARVFFVVDGTKTKYAVGSGEGYWRNVFELEGWFLGRQELEFIWSAEAYREQVAPARTVVLETEMEAVKAAGLGKGLDESSCLGIGREGFLNEARFGDEPVRHKLLDLIGDLALSGVPVAHLDVVGEWTGHAANVAAALKLTEAVVIRRLP